MRKIIRELSQSDYVDKSINNFLTNYASHAAILVLMRPQDQATVSRSKLV